MTLQPNGTAPYAPPKAVIDIITTYRERDMRKPFSLDVLMQAGVTESLAPRTLQALKLLDIVDSEGNPTEQFDALVRAPDEEFQQGLADLFCNAYRDIFSFADPSTNDLSRIRDAFRPYRPRGQHERMITMFLGLLEFAGVDVSAAKVGTRPKKDGQSTGRRRPAPAGKSKRKADSRTPRNEQNGSDSPPPHRSDTLFGVTEADMALLNDDEFDQVWEALGRVTKARARAIRAKDSASTKRTARVEQEGGHMT